MEKIIILGIVFLSIALAVYKAIRFFKGKDACFGCMNKKRCKRDT